MTREEVRKRYEELQEESDNLSDCMEYGSKFLDCLSCDSLATSVNDYVLANLVTEKIKEARDRKMETLNAFNKLQDECKHTHIIMWGASHQCADCYKYISEED